MRSKFLGVCVLVALLIGVLPTSPVAAQAKKKKKPRPKRPALVIPKVGKEFTLTK